MADALTSERAALLNFKERSLILIATESLRGCTVHSYHLL